MDKRDTSGGVLTPRVDEEVEIAKRFPETNHGLWISAEFARQLERELAEANNKIHEMEITVPHSTIIGLRQEIERLSRSAIAPTRDQMKEAKAQAAQEWDRWKANSLSLYDGAPEMTRLRMAHEAGFVHAFLRSGAGAVGAKWEKIDDMPENVTHLVWPGETLYCYHPRHGCFKLVTPQGLVATEEGKT